MKNHQTIKTVLSLLLFASILFSFKTSNAQTHIYARLERQDYNYYDGSSGTTPEYPTRLYIAYECYVRFYTDNTCTVPVTLDEDVNAAFNVVEYYDEGLNYGGTYDLTNNITPGNGQTEVYLGTFIQQDLYYDVYNTGWGLQCVEGGMTVSGVNNNHIYDVSQ